MSTLPALDTLLALSTLLPMSPSLELPVRVGVFAAAVALGVVALRGRRHRRIRLGVALVPGWGRDLLAGVLLGTIAMATIGLVLLLGGAARIVAVQPSPTTVIGWLVVLTALAAYEELLFRVLLVSGLLALTRSTTVAIVVSVSLTALNHLFTDGVTALSITSAALGGLMYTVAYLRTHRWWLPLGLHLAWNVVQGPILGHSVSGTSVGPGAVFTQEVTGPTWLTGGDYGPEASVAALVVRVLVIVAILVLTRKAHSPALRSGGRTPR